MHETKEKVKKLCDLNEKIVCFMTSTMASGGCDSLNLAEAGAFIDMIKDLAEAEKNEWKACYYKKMVEGMEPPTEEEMRKYEEGRMGYDNWRYPSSGKFATKGHGERYGYTPDDMIPQFMHDDMRKPIYGYDDNAYRGNYKIDQESDRYGKAYKDWSRAKKYYTETNSQSDKDEMSLHAKEHLNDVVVTIREMWKSADPDLRKEIKKNLTTLTAEMPV